MERINSFLNSEGRNSPYYGALKTIVDSKSRWQFWFVATRATIEGVVLVVSQFVCLVFQGTFDWFVHDDAACYKKRWHLLKVQSVLLAKTLKMFYDRFFKGAESFSQARAAMEIDMERPVNFSNLDKAIKKFPLCKLKLLQTEQSSRNEIEITEEEVLSIKEHQQEFYKDCVPCLYLNRFISQTEIYRSPQEGDQYYVTIVFIPKDKEQLLKDRCNKIGLTPPIFLIQDGSYKNGYKIKIPIMSLFASIWIETLGSFRVSSIMITVDIDCSLYSGAKIFVKAFNSCLQIAFRGTEEGYSYKKQELEILIKILEEELVTESIEGVRSYMLKKPYRLFDSTFKIANNAQVISPLLVKWIESYLKFLSEYKKKNPEAEVEILVPLAYRQLPDPNIKEGASLIFISLVPEARKQHIELLCKKFDVTASISLFDECYRGQDIKTATLPEVPLLLSCWIQACQPYGEVSINRFFLSGLITKEQCSKILEFIDDAPRKLVEGMLNDFMFFSSSRFSGNFDTYDVTQGDQLHIGLHQQYLTAPEKYKIKDAERISFAKVYKDYIQDVWCDFYSKLARKARFSDHLIDLKVLIYCDDENICFSFISEKRQNEINQLYKTFKASEPIYFFDAIDNEKEIKMDKLPKINETYIGLIQSFDRFEKNYFSVIANIIEREENSEEKCGYLKIEDVRELVDVAKKLKEKNPQIEIHMEDLIVGLYKRVLYKENKDEQEVEFLIDLIDEFPKVASEVYLRIYPEINEQRVAFLWRCQIFKKERNLTIPKNIKMLILQKMLTFEFIDKVKEVKTVDKDVGDNI